MALRLKFISAVIRKADIAAHYPGGCPAFESVHAVSSEDDALYALVSMSGSGIEDQFDALRASGFDADRFVALADMWSGPIRQVPGIAFAAEGDDFPPLWIARAVPLRPCLKREL